MVWRFAIALYCPSCNGLLTIISVPEDYNVTCCLGVLTSEDLVGRCPGRRRVVCHPGLYVFIFLYGIHACRMPVMLTGIGVVGVNVSLTTQHLLADVIDAGPFYHIGYLYGLV